MTLHNVRQWVGLLLLAMCAGFPLSAANAEQLTVTAGFNVEATSDMPGYTGRAIMGSSDFSIPGFNPAFGTLQSIQESANAGYTYAVTVNSLVGFPTGASLQFLSPIHHVTNAFTAITTYPIPYQAVRNLEPTGPGVYTLSGGFPPTVNVGFPNELTPGDYITSGSVGMQAHFTAGHQYCCAPPSGGSAYGTYSVTYNFTAGPGYTRDPVVIKTNSPGPFPDQLVFTPATPTYKSATDYVGAASQVEGTPTLIRPDGTRETIKPGTPVRMGDIIETEPGQQVRLGWASSTRAV